MKFHVYNHVVVDEHFLGAFSQSMNAAIFIRAYHNEYADASVYVRTNGHMRHIDRDRTLDEINTQLVEMTAPLDRPISRACAGTRT